MPGWKEEMLNMSGHPFERLSYDAEYDRALSYLYNLQKFGIKFGLSKTENLLRAFNHPQRHLRSIHLAGSNGKGSVAAMLAAVYQQAGYRVGLFTSPHLIDFRERFRINGQMISKDRTLNLIKEIKEKTDQKEPPTFFEFVTAMALLYFYREKVDLAVMETGLGGRLDATNVIHPLISVITTISLEHREHLGNTLEKIAYEKGGIIKYQTPLVTGVKQKKVRDLFERLCRVKQATMLLAGRDFKARKSGPGRFSYSGLGISDFGIKSPADPDTELRNHELLSAPPSVLRYSKLKVGLLGDHQIQNAGLALAVIDYLKKNYAVPEKALREGLAEVTWPGRMEVLSERPCLVLDGAHNPEAMRILSKNLPKVFSYKKLLIVLGMMKDKDIGHSVKYLIPLADTVFLTRAEYDRSADPESLLPLCRGKIPACSVVPTVPLAIKAARAKAGADDMILITGSLFIVGEAKAWWEGQGEVESWNP
jgi:dihydrofolate synthase / folylpolyglutamate synthase